MEIYKQTETIITIGQQVPTFPNGIKEAFGNLMKTLGNNRAYYGISWMDEDDKVIYYAMAQEAFPGEGRQHNYDILPIEKGEYRGEAIQNWMSKTDSIKDVFHNLMGNIKADKNHPCIEWYMSDDEMVCMVKDK